MKYSQKSKQMRHKLIGNNNSKVADEKDCITNMQELERELQNAIILEHFTIPPYLCALYSIKDGANNDSCDIIRSVVVEEMLHMIMVANIMNALNMKPEINTALAYPKYRGPLPVGSDFQVSLLKFSKEAVNTFLRIERPAPDMPAGRFPSIGQYYAAIREALVDLDGKTLGGIFKGECERQVTEEHYYGSGGKLISVYTLNDALEALDEIVGQGEGIDGSINDGDIEMSAGDAERAHYFRFNEIFYERRYKQGDMPHDPPSGEHMPVDWNDVYNMVPNPKMNEYKDDHYLHGKMKAFNKTYRRLLDNIHEGCNGNPDILLDGVPLMRRLKEQAVELMKIPSGNGNYTLGPSFEYVP